MNQSVKTTRAVVMVETIYHEIGRGRTGVPTYLYKLIGVVIDDVSSLSGERVSNGRTSLNNRTEPAKWIAVVRVGVLEIGTQANGRIDLIGLVRAVVLTRVL